MYYERWPWQPIYLLLLIIFWPQLVLQCSYFTLQCSFSPWFLILRSIVKRGRAMIPTMDTTTASCTLHRWFANKKYRKGKNCHEIFADVALIIWKQKVEKSLTNIKRLIYVLLWNLCCPWPLAPAWHQLGTPEEVTIFAQFLHNPKLSKCIHFSYAVQQLFFANVQCIVLWNRWKMFDLFAYL